MEEHLVSGAEKQTTEVGIAEIEVDVSGLEERIRGLDLDIHEADSDLRAVLEVAGVTVSR